MTGIKVNARIRLEQDVDLVLMSRKLRTFCKPHDEVLLTTDRRFKHYKANGVRIFLKDGLLFRNCRGQTGSIKYYQIPILKQLFDKVLRSLSGKYGKHPKIVKTFFCLQRKLSLTELGIVDQEAGHVM